MEPSSEKSKSVQVEIFPQRLLFPNTAQKLLNEINDIKGVKRILIQGPHLPSVVSFGPGTGSPIDQKGRQLIKIGESVFELEIEIGRIRLEVENRSVKEEVRKACEKVLPFPFEFREGFFLHSRPTVTDYAKHGPDADKSILGMIDVKSKIKDAMCVVVSESVD
ncbi:MAG: methyl-coenzyme M reductase operon protein D [Methanosarcinales archaeon]